MKRVYVPDMSDSRVRTQEFRHGAMVVALTTIAVEVMPNSSFVSTEMDGADGGFAIGTLDIRKVDVDEMAKGDGVSPSCGRAQLPCSFSNWTLLIEVASYTIWIWFLPLLLYHGYFSVDRSHSLSLSAPLVVLKPTPEMRREPYLSQTNRSPLRR